MAWRLAHLSKIGQPFSGSGTSLNVAKGYFARMRSSKRRRDDCATVSKTLAMLRAGADESIVLMRAKRRRLSPAPWRLSLHHISAPAATELDTFMRCSTSEALRTQYRPQ